MSIDERSLAEVDDDVTDEAALADIETAAPGEQAEDFDFASWVDGVRPNRVRVVLSQKNHLIPQMDALIDRIESAADEDVDALVAEYEELRAEWEQSRRTLIVEARSSDRLQAIAKAAKKQGLDPQKPDDIKTVVYRQVADQIVSPAGVKPESIRALYEANEVEGDKLFRACKTANNATAVAPGLSQKPSGTRRSG